MEQEQYRRLLPGYIRRFVDTAAPLVDLRIDGDSGGVFELVPERPRGLDHVLGAMEFYPPEIQGRFTVYRPMDRHDAIWMHPGEPVFDRFCATLLYRYADEARRGAIFVDPNVQAPYLFHLAQVSIVRGHPIEESVDLLPDRTGKPDDRRTDVVESCLVGIRQEADGTISTCPLEHILLLRGAANVAPGGVPLAGMARKLIEHAKDWISADVLSQMVGEHRAQIEATLPERLDWVVRGYDHKTAELIAKRQRVNEDARRGDARAKAELTKVKDQQRQLVAERGAPSRPPQDGTFPDRAGRNPDDRPCVGAADR